MQSPSVSTSPRWRIGVDLGGTKIEVIAIDREGMEALRRRTDTPAGQYEETIEAIATLVLDVERALGEVASVGVGTPGAVGGVDGRIKNSNSTVLNGRALGRDLETRLGRAVRLANDANCFALSEARDGAARDADGVFGVILGTGVGGGIVWDGKPVRGRNAIAGEWGHVPLPLPRPEETPGPSCYCGRQGCVETWLSGPGLARAYAHAGGDGVDARAIATRARAGEARADRVIDEWIDRLARALSLVVNIVDPAVIVMGGGLSNIDRLYDELPARLVPHVFSDSVSTRIVRNLHGDSSGVRGAAWLWP
ncbi:MAG: ROK family protein [Burkholderiaceae bacterium]|nr:ROK family protein [Burkholderiaceae bacterium]